MGCVTPHNDYWIYGLCTKQMISGYMGSVTPRKWFLNIWAVWPHKMISEYMDRAPPNDFCIPVHQMISEYMGSVTLTKWFLNIWQCDRKKWFLNIWTVWPHKMISDYMGSVTTQNDFWIYGSVTPPNDFWIYGQCDPKKDF